MAKDLSKLAKQKKIYAPYFIEEVRRKIIDNYGDTSLYREGLNVITTIDIVIKISCKINSS